MRKFEGGDGGGYGRLIEPLLYIPPRSLTFSGCLVSALLPSSMAKRVLALFVKGLGCFRRSLTRSRSALPIARVQLRWNERAAGGSSNVKEYCGGRGREAFGRGAVSCLCPYVMYPQVSEHNEVYSLCSLRCQHSPPRPPPPFLYTFALSHLLLLALVNEGDDAPVKLGV